MQVVSGPALSWRTNVRTFVRQREAALVRCCHGEDLGLTPLSRIDGGDPRPAAAGSRGGRSQKRHDYCVAHDAGDGGLIQTSAPRCRFIVTMFDSGQ